MPRATRRSFLRSAAALVVLSATGCGATPTPAPPSPTSVPAAVPSPVPSLAPAVLSPTAVTQQPTATAVPAVPAAATQTPARAASNTPAPRASNTPAPSATPAPVSGQAYMAVAHGASPEAITRAALAALGGMGRFVKPGNDVIIKPNICSASFSFEYAATTNPEVVATLVTLCREAGAKRVRVMDSPFSGTDGQAYAISGIEEAVKKAGGEMERMARMKYQEAAIAQGKDLKKWSVYQDALQTDVLINAPIAKNHNLARLTLGMKNLMGLILDRSQIHYNLGQRLADLTTLLKPALTVVDAVRILTQGGPTGGSLSYVKKMDTVIASHDIVATDAFGATLFGMKGDDLDYVRAAAAMGLGRKDIENLKIERIAV